MNKFLTNVCLIFAFLSVTSPALSHEEFPYDLYTPITIMGIYNALHSLHKSEVPSNEAVFTVHTATDRYSFIGFMASPLTPISDAERERLGYIHKVVVGTLGQAPFDMMKIKYKMVITDNRSNIVLYVQEALVSDLLEKLESDPSSPIQCFSMVLGHSYANEEATEVILSLNSYVDI